MRKTAIVLIKIAMVVAVTVAVSFSVALHVAVSVLYMTKTSLQHPRTKIHF
jgi:hypothetical protein